MNPASENEPAYSQNVLPYLF